MCVGGESIDRTFSNCAVCTIADILPGLLSEMQILGCHLTDWIRNLGIGPEICFSIPPVDSDICSSLGKETIILRNLVVKKTDT